MTQPNPIEGAAFPTLDQLSERSRRHQESQARERHGRQALIPELVRQSPVAKGHEQPHREHQPCEDQRVRPEHGKILNRDLARFLIFLKKLEGVFKVHERATSSLRPGAQAQHFCSLPPVEGGLSWGHVPEDQVLSAR